MQPNRDTIPSFLTAAAGDHSQVTTGNHEVVFSSSFDELPECRGFPDPHSATSGPEPNPEPHTQIRNLIRHGAQLGGFEDGNRPTVEANRQEDNNLVEELFQYRNCEEIMRHQDRGGRILNEETQTTPPRRCLLSTENIPTDPTPPLGRTTGEFHNRTLRDMEGLETRMVTILRTTLEGLADAIRGTPRTQRWILPTFEGTEWENPREFLEAIQRTATKEGIHKADWTILAADQLRGEACGWYENYRALKLDFETFQHRLISRYDNMEIRSQLRAKLFGQRQDKEPVDIFISRKVALYRRIAPETLEEEKICHVKTLLIPEIRMDLRGVHVGSIEELIQIASAMESDLQEVQHRSCNTSYAAINARAIKPVQGQGGSTRLSITQGETRNPRRPPYPCQYCGGDHFHRNCTNNIQRVSPSGAQLAIESSTTRNNQGNEIRAAGLRESTSQPERRNH